LIESSVPALERASSAAALRDRTPPFTSKPWFTLGTKKEVLLTFEWVRETKFAG